MDSFEDVISKEVDGPVTSFVIIASYLNEDGDNMVYFKDQDDQSTHLSLGLVELAKIYLTKKLMIDLDLD
jgi:hypothetical protein